MNNINIIVGSVTGTATSVARFLNKKLSDRLNVMLFEYPCVNEILSEREALWIFCVSNTGVGELPPNMRKLYVQLSEQDRDLSNIEYAVINLADSSFKSFAKSGITLDEALQACNATRIEERLVIDAMLDRYPRQSALNWAEDMLAKRGML